MISDLLQYGQLHLSTEALPEVLVSPAWQDLTSNRIAVVVTVFVLLLNLPVFYRILPDLIASLTLARANISLEHSLSTARARNSTAIVMTLPFCLLADRFRIFDNPFTQNTIPELSLVFTFAVFTGFLLARRLLWELCTKRVFKYSDAGKASHFCFYNFFIWLSFLWITTYLLLAVFHLQDSVYQVVLLIEAGLVYLIALLRTMQILASNCNLLSTILYLCGLELLPIAMLVFCITEA